MTRGGAGSWRWVEKMSWWEGGLRIATWTGGDGGGWVDGGGGGGVTRG